MTAAWREASDVHAVQFYERDAVLHRAIERFLTPALRQGAPVGIVARRRTFEAVRDRLTADLAGRMTFVDVEAVLPQIMDGDRPDPARVEQGFSGLISDLRRGGRNQKIWLYGEVADVLCEHELHPAAVRLEELWNLKFGAANVSLMCGYAMPHVGGTATASHFEQVCRQHSHVVPTVTATAAAATIYVVDDDASVRQSLARLLSAADLRVRTFPSAEAFLHEADRDARGCLIVDVQLVGISGTELQARMADARWDMPVIAISASYDPRVEQDALRLGARAFLRKPFDAETLLEEIARALLA